MIIIKNALSLLVVDRHFAYGTVVAGGGRAIHSPPNCYKCTC